MAKQIIEMIIDDIDGGDADETVRFAVDGVQYEIDLSKRNAEKLREALEPFRAAGRKVVALNGRPAKFGASYQGGTRTAGASVDRAQNKAVRDWAKRSRIELADRGRIPAWIEEEYQRSGGKALQFDGVGTMTVGELRAYAVRIGLSTGTKADTVPALLAVIREWESRKVDPDDMATTTGAAVATAVKSAAARKATPAKKTTTTAKVPAKAAKVPDAVFKPAKAGGRVATTTAAKKTARKAAAR